MTLIIHNNLICSCRVWEGEGGGGRRKGGEFYSRVTFRYGYIEFVVGISKNVIVI